MSVSRTTAVASEMAAAVVTGAWNVASGLGRAHLGQSCDEFAERSVSVDRTMIMASGRLASGVNDVRDGHVMAAPDAALYG